MSFEVDPDLSRVLAARAAEAAGTKVPARGDVLGLRALIDENTPKSVGSAPYAPDVGTRVFDVPAGDARIPVRWYERRGSSPGSAVVYLHGGGMIAGTLDDFEPLARHYAQLTGVPFLLVGYRLAPEHPGTIPAEDAFAALAWLSGHAAELGVDPARIAVMGDSGGGGVGAGAVILARERGVAVARQILIYPMLDDRTVDPDRYLAPMPTWSYDNNFTCWDAVLGGERGGPGVSPVAAPARLTDFAGLPPAFVEVGELDIFRDESIAYASGLLLAGISCELHVHPGCPHGYDWLDHRSAVSRRSVESRVRVISAL
ncbi:alpha/beta hydrolase [Amycolatopsis acidicola]|uniref:Alpha/beta hydrolase n=1 Tax=Amycolatopsis acidicola TaxID=2596893 RepID=A0A5N0UVW7_9PSEU|nr:alpha/beta hydrolase [Amycolatopsis acidicola]KAA9156202.1 alpha/beta hydrolase [Amycolatopsis acidicola]